MNIQAYQHTHQYEDQRIDFYRDLMVLNHAILEDHQAWMQQQHQEALALIQPRQRVRIAETA